MSGIIDWLLGLTVLAGTGLLLLFIPFQIVFILVTGHPWPGEPAWRR